MNPPWSPGNSITGAPNASANASPVRWASCP
jgi:hypothetical protein